MFSADLTLVEVRDNWLKADGTPESGTITFTPSVRVLDVDSGQQIAPTATKVSLDNSGQISVMVPATDDPDYSPVGWTYRVDVKLDSYAASYNVTIPLAAATNGVDLGLLTPVPTSPGTFQPFDAFSAAFEAALVLGF